MRFRRFCIVLAALPLLQGPGRAAEPELAARRFGDVTQARVLAEAASGENWLVNGGRFSGEHYSPLDEINDRSIEKLGLAWATDIPSRIGLVAEPLVVDGVVYLSGSFSVVYALDAATGQQLWQFDPEVRLDFSHANSWSSRFNRGVAVWNGKVYVGTGDCRLVAVTAQRGEKIWEARVCDPTEAGGAGITGAPRVGNGRVFIGYLGSDWGVRGSLVAFDAETGNEDWRFWTVPGEPSKGFESPELAMAAKSWVRDGWAKNGGGVVWEAIRYDAVTDLVIFGTASAAPINTSLRGPGDHLFTNSVIAVEANTGAYRWHYQTVPADAWDYDATMPKIVTDLEFNGKLRRVVLEVPKNGFFYVLDAYTGELLSADAFVPVTWATHVDLETGRPVEVPAARYYESQDSEGPVRVSPSAAGAHVWHPMSYSPDTGLVYIPATDMPTAFFPGGFFGARVELLNYAPHEEPPPGVGKLLAWDPLTRAIRWSVDHTRPFNGGVLSTAGNLVFQGTATAEFRAYSADKGEILWSRKTGSAIQAAPVSYRVGGEQYVLIPIGKGGGYTITSGSRIASRDARGPSRLLAFKLGGRREIPISPLRIAPVPKPPPRTASAEQVERGLSLYARFGCQLCHGRSVIGVEERILGGAIPDLRYMPAAVHEEWQGIVLGGSRRLLGMPNFLEEGMTAEDSEAIHAYVIDAAWQAYERSQNQSAH